MPALACRLELRCLTVLHVFLQLLLLGDQSSKSQIPFHLQRLLLSLSNPDEGYRTLWCGGTYVAIGLADPVVNRMESVDSKTTNRRKTMKRVIASPSSFLIPSGLYWIPAGICNMFAGLRTYCRDTTGAGPASMGPMHMGNETDLFTPMDGKTCDSRFTVKAIAFVVPFGSALDPRGVDIVSSTPQEFRTP
jgi:hypothetical protein